MPPFITNEDWFIHLTNINQHKFFERFFEGDFQAFLVWCSKPYSEKSKHKYIKAWLKQK